MPAHCTLFHKLPGEREEEVVRLIGAIAEAARPFTAFTSGVLNFGRGVAYALDAPTLIALREDIGHAMSPWLSDQDRQRYRPHVTIQNKADPAAARALLASLEDDFAPSPVRIEGLSLWRYRGGPWEPAAAFRFGQPPVVQAPPARS